MSILQVDFKAANASTEFAKSLKETGFAVIKNHPIDYQLVLDVFKEWEGFFNSTYKQDYLFDRETQDGFFPMSVSETAVGYSVKDIKEFYHYYPWGKFPSQLSDKSKQLQKQMQEIASTLLVWVEENLPADIKQNLSEPLTNMIEGSKGNLMRILHYPPLTGQETEGAVRAGAHGDINLLTVLVAASQSGLQLKDSTGKWVDVPVDPGMLAINIGDMLELATNGYFKSTLHQVVNPTDETRHKSRYSIPLFLHPRDDVKLSADKTAGQFLHERLVALGVKK
ncbi:MAG: isopenicillin N synthase family oxygenase [Neisseriaceae bacterium]|nr:MAG: isopenicillin N synthase family oxygenase [Neisseriaceae bacterium]